MTEEQSLPPEEEGYGLIMPFIVCESAGGALDDEAFTIGYEIGVIDQELAVCNVLFSEPRERYVHQVALPQLDLVAMRRGFVLVLGDEDESGEWRSVGFVRGSDEDDE